MCECNAASIGRSSGRAVVNVRHEREGVDSVNALSLFASILVMGVVHFVL